MAKRRKEPDTNGILIFTSKMGEQMSLFEGDEHPIYSEQRIILDRKKLLRRTNKNENKL